MPLPGVPFFSRKEEWSSDKQHREKDKRDHSVPYLSMMHLECLRAIFLLIILFVASCRLGSVVAIGDALTTLADDSPILFTIKPSQAARLEQCSRVADLAANSPPNADSSVKQSTPINSSRAAAAECADVFQSAVYHAWMHTLQRRHERLSRAAAFRDASIYDRNHPDDVAQEIADVFDVRMPYQKEDTGGDAFYEEHVLGGKLTREELMVSHLRARTRASLRHQAAVVGERQRRHVIHMNDALEAGRLKQKSTTSPGGWWIYVWTLLDGAALVLLVVVPIQMLLSMRTGSSNRHLLLGAPPGNNRRERNHGPS